MGERTGRLRGGGPFVPWIAPGLQGLTKREWDMDRAGRMRRLLAGMGVGLLQLVMTQVVTFLFSVILPGMETWPQTRPAPFVVILGVAYSIGVFLAGWVALRRSWLHTEPRYSQRLVGTIVGAYLPLAIGLILYHPLGVGNPYFLVSALACVLGFHAPGLFEKM